MAKKTTRKKTTRKPQVTLSTGKKVDTNAIQVTKPEDKKEEADVQLSEESQAEVQAEPQEAEEVILSKEDTIKNALSLWASQTPNIKVPVYIYTDKKTGEAKMILSVALDQDRKDTLKEAGLDFEEHTYHFEFEMVNSSQLDSYRNFATRMDNQGNLVVINNLIKEKILQNHLVDTDFPSPDGKSIEIKRDSNGVLFAETESQINDLHPMVKDIFMRGFQVESGINY
jgi:hypothetical protein